MPQTAHELLNELENRGLVSASVLSSLKSQVAKAARPIAAATVVKLLVEKRHLTAAQAAHLLGTEPGAANKPAPAAANKAATAKPVGSKSAALELSSLEELQPLDELQPLADLTPLDDLPLDNLSTDDLAPLNEVQPVGNLKPLSQPAPAAVIPLDDLSALDPFAAASSTKAVKGPAPQRSAARPISAAAPLVAIPPAAVATPVRRRSSLGIIATILVVVVLLGGGAAAAFALLGRGDGAELFAEAQQDYESKQFDAAAAKYQTLLVDYPDSEHVALAQVRLAAARVLSARSASPQSWEKVLAAAKEYLLPVVSIAESSQVQADLAPLVTDMAAELASQAADGAAAADKVAAARDALALANDGRIVPSESRQWQRLELAADSIALAERDAERPQAIQAAVAAIQKAASAGDCQTAFAERAKLVALSPDAAGDSSLRDAMRSLATAAAGKVATAQYGALAESSERDAGILGSVVFATTLKTGSASTAGSPTVLSALGSTWCMDSATGRVLWRRGGADSPIYVGPDANGSVLLVENNSQELVRVDSQSGKLAWRHRLPGPIAGVPLVLGGRVMATTQAGLLVDVDLQSGAGRASAQLPQTARVGPIAGTGGQQVIQLSDEGLLFVLSESDLACLRAVYVGHERATVTTSPTLLSRHLVVVENRASNSSMLHVLTLDDGGLPETVVQTIEVASQILSQPVVLSGKLLAVTTGGRVLAWESASEPQSGLTEVAKTDLGTAQDKSPTSLARFPLVASDELLVAGQGLRLLAPPANGTLKPVWSALADDTLLSQPYHSGETIVTLRRTTAGGGILAAGVSAADGKVHWETRLGERIVRLEFSSGGGNARAVTAGGASAEFSVADLKGQHTAALSPASPTKSATSTVPAKRLAWRDGLVLISASGEVTYVDAASGALKADPLQLRLQPGQRLDRCDAAPVGEGGMKLAVSDGHAMLLLLDLAGEGGPQIVELASAKLAAAPTSGLIVGDNLVGLIDRRGQLATFSLSDLSLGAAIDIGTGAVLAGPTRVGELTILATGRAELVALDRGLAIAWRVPFGRGLPAGDLLSAEGKLLLACRSGRLCVHDGKTGQELAASDLGEPLAGTPLVVGGQVLVPTAAGAVLHVEIPVPREAAP